MARALIGGLHLHHRLLSPVLPGGCRFWPSCSSFAIEALERHGTGWGLRLAAGRVLRCHPWNPGGYDPVPEGEHRSPSGGR